MIQKEVLLRNNGTRLAQRLATFCKKNIWRGSERDRVEIEKEITKILNCLCYRYRLFIIYMIACFFFLFCFFFALHTRRGTMI